MLLATSSRSVGSFCKPPLKTFNVYVVAGLSSVNVSVTVTGAPVPRVYVFGPNGTHVPARPTEGRSKTPRMAINVPKKQILRGWVMGVLLTCVLQNPDRGRVVAPKSFAVSNSAKQGRI